MQPELQPIRTDDSLRRLPSAGGAVSAQHNVLRNTYWLLALSLIPTAIGAMVGTSINWGFMRASPVSAATSSGDVVSVAWYACSAAAKSPSAKESARACPQASKAHNGSATRSARILTHPKQRG